MRLFAILLLVMIAACAGCRSCNSALSIYSTEIRECELPSRIVVVPFNAPRCNDEAGALATAAFSKELQRILKGDVIQAQPGDERLRAETAMWDRGRIDVNTLIEAHNSYFNDAFLFGTVTHYKAYDPPLLGVKVRLISATTGEIIWSAGGVLDSHDAGVRCVAREYFNESGLSESLYGHDLIFMSPRLFTEFAAAKIMGQLEQQLQAEKEAIERSKIADFRADSR